MEELKTIVLTADDILTGVVELDQELVKISKGRAVYVREMTGQEKTEWELTGMKKSPSIGGKQGGMEMNLEDYRMKLAIFTMCDVDGNRLFDNDFLIPRKLKDLGSKFKASDLEAIVDKASELNKIRPEDQEAMLKNSEADVKDSSTSASA